MQVFPATFGAKEDENSLTIFDKNNRLKVTRFQRTYTWDSSQWMLLLKDIEFMSEEKQLVAWPSIILQEVPDKSKPNQRIYWIGDGQQRITTIYVCLLAIWQSSRVQLLKEQLNTPSWIRELLPEANDGRGTAGMLGDVVEGIYGPKVESKLSFSSKEIQGDIESLMEPLREGDWKRINEKIEDQGKSSRLFEAFKYFYEWAENQETETLEEYVGLALRNIMLSAVVFAQDENMERAYGNMNSGGKALTEDELIKAIIYRTLKDHSQELADSMADFWIKEFEDVTWWKEVAKGVKGRSRVYRFLYDKHALETSWRIAAARNPTDIADKERDPHWLSNNWSEIVSNLSSDPKAIEDFWTDFKMDKENFEEIHGKNDQVKGSLKWLLSYANSNGVDASILMWLMRAMNDEEEVKKTIWLLVKYSTYVGLINGDGNFPQLLIASGSPIYKSSPDYTDFVRWSLTAKSKWKSSEDIEKVLRDKIYSAARYNSFLTNAFIYINNRKSEESRNRESLFSKSKDSLDPKKSREHILSQKPVGFDTWSEQDKKDHTDLVSRLGNVLIISSTKNSELQNKPVKDKISTYRGEVNSLVGSFWVQDFLDDYENGGMSWEEADINKRSSKLAKLIAPYLAAPEHPDEPLTLNTSSE